METHDHHAAVKLEDITSSQIHADVKHPITLTQVHSDGHHTTTLSLGHHVTSMSDISEPSSPDSTTFDESDLLSGQVVSEDISDEVTAQLAAAGPVGMAAAAAIITGKKRKKNTYAFETNPSIRKRQATRLLRKLKLLLTEYTTRVGQQACIIICCPGKMGSSFKSFGAAPLENIVKNHKHLILEDLENALSQQTPQVLGNPDAHELPPLIMEGFPTPVDKMTQAQLRAFIPIMLKYSTGRGKPGWGRENTKPAWWPVEVPWANVRSDVRSEEDKQNLSWTNALRTVVRNCYQYHGREELLDAFSHNGPEQQPGQAQVFASQYPHLVHTINNDDGTVSIIQVDATGTVTTLSDTATHSEATQAVATLAEVASASQGEGIYSTHHVEHISHDQHSHIEHNITHEHGTSMAENAIHEGQMLLGGAVSAAAALVGVQGSGGTEIVSIPVQAAAAMMQIQGTNLIPVSISSGGNVQFIATSSLPPNFQIAHQSQSSEHPGSLSMDVTIRQAIQDAQNASETSSVPSATQAVEVVTLSEQQQHQQGVT